MKRCGITLFVAFFITSCGSTDSPTSLPGDAIEDSQITDAGQDKPDLNGAGDSLESDLSGEDSGQPLLDMNESEEIQSPDTRTTPDTETVDCASNPAVFLRIYPLDIWAQPLDIATITFESTATGNTLLEVSATPVAIPLCQAQQFKVRVKADDHEPMEVVFDFDGSSSANGLTMSAPATEVAYVYTSELKDFESNPEVPHFTLWTGLPHLWFAPGGYPARKGNHMELLGNGDDAWSAVASDLAVAEEQVLVTSWWWSSYFEVVRDPFDHIWLTPELRWKNTIMAHLEALVGVEKKILINQFLTQDGFFSQYNVDDELIAKAETPGDQFEFMGIANPSSGSFFAKPPLVNFSKRLENALGGDPMDEITVSKAGLTAFSPPIPVDINVPFILTELNIPIASWHQKLVTIDGKVALVGGMNLQGDDWDSNDHTLYESRRMEFGAALAERQAVAAKEQLPDYPASKDYMIRIEGPVAADVEGLFVALWQYQLENSVLYADLSTPAVTHPLPEPIVPGNNVVQAQLLMTLPAPFHRYSVLEVLERAIARAQSYIFIEDQYLRSPRLTLALKTRMMAVPNLKLIVITSPINAWTDPACWQTHVENEILHGLFPSRFRTYQLKSFDAVDTNCTFCVEEVLATFQNHYLHSKLVIIDDLFLEVGSANHNNRSMLYDAELAVAVFDSQWVKSEREKVTKEILGNYYKGEMTPDQLFEKFEKGAAANQGIYELWEADDFDKNLNGAPIPSYLKPRGFLYPLSFGTPESCTFDNVGGDIM